MKAFTKVFYFLILTANVFFAQFGFAAEPSWSISGDFSTRPSDNPEVILARSMTFKNNSQNPLILQITLLGDRNGDLGYSVRFVDDEVGRYFARLYKENGLGTTDSLMPCSYCQRRSRLEKTELMLTASVLHLIDPLSESVKEIISNKIGWDFSLEAVDRTMNRYQSLLINFPRENNFQSRLINHIDLFDKVMGQDDYSKKLFRLKVVQQFETSFTFTYCLLDELVKSRIFAEKAHAMLGRHLSASDPDKAMEHFLQAGNEISENEFNEFRNKNMQPDFEGSGKDLDEKSDV